MRNTAKKTKPSFVLLFLEMNGFILSSFFEAAADMVKPNDDFFFYAFGNDSPFQGRFHTPEGWGCLQNSLRNCLQAPVKCPRFHDGTYAPAPIAAAHGWNAFCIP